jgi:FkbM family methyltransferase
MAVSSASLRILLRDKAARESALLATPDARAAYLASLAALAEGRSGLLHAVFPELGHPLYLRAGSADLAALRRVMGEARLGWLPASPPRRILDLGAHAGYVAAGLAARYPDATILCVEPDPDTHRILTLNTLPYPGIRRSASAAWHSVTRLGPAGRDEAGFGPRLTDALPPGARPIQAAPVSDLLASAGMAGADMLLCDTSGAEAALFADPGAPWLAGIDTAAIDIREDLSPGTTALVQACFPVALFETTWHGVTTVFRRRVATAGPPARRLPLLHSAPGLLAFSLHDVPPEPWGFFIFDGGSCQLHPNPPGGPPASVRFIRRLSGQSRLVSGIAHAGAMAAPIRFGATLASTAGTPLAHTAQVLAAGEAGRLDLVLPPGLTGPHLVMLETAMLQAARTTATPGPASWCRR